jgi:hypothetical protein
MGRRVAEKVLRDAAGTSPLDVTHGDADEAERGAIGRRQAVRIIEQAPDDLTPDGARAEYGDAQRSRPHGTGL